MRSATPTYQSEGSLIVQEGPVQCKKMGTLKTPKTKTSATTPARVKGATAATPKRKTMTKTSTTATTLPPHMTNVPVSVEQLPSAPALIPIHPILIDGEAPSKGTWTLAQLEKLPILNTVTVRNKKTFKKDPKRVSREEGWVGTERGEIAAKACNECSRGNNPFTLCCVVEGTVHKKITQSTRNNG